MNVIMQDSENYKFKNIFIMDYVPSILSRNIDNRPASTFMYVEKGSYIYTGKNMNFSVNSGDIIYIPQNSNYTFTITSDITHCIQITFNLEFETHADNIFLSTPYVFRNINCIESFHSAYKHYNKNNIFGVMSDIYRIISSYKKSYNHEMQQYTDYNKIKPAIEYINQHFTESIYIDRLADLCNLSQSHFRRLFVRVTGFSPIQYKNSILYSAARNLIKNEQISISDVSYTLNFPDVYSFSKFFKKHAGISPRKFAQTDLM